ncbi:hypothetical protein JW926_07330, partial [Candidatus Sumerlaeota bacterium]|nr:hypothetical protein [Candidatus Sumerlaeota bacterium]
RVIFDPEARNEFLAAIRRYEECQKGLGLRFRLLVESARAVFVRILSVIAFFTPLSGAVFSRSSHIRSSSRLSRSIFWSLPWRMRNVSPVSGKNALRDIDNALTMRYGIDTMDIDDPFGIWQS